MPLAVLPITALEAQSEKYQRVYSDESQTERLKALLGADRVEFGGAADGSHVAVGEEVVVPRCGLACAPLLKHLLVGVAAASVLPPSANRPICTKICRAICRKASHMTCWCLKSFSATC